VQAESNTVPGGRGSQGQTVVAASGRQRHPGLLREELHQPQTPTRPSMTRRSQPYVTGGGGTSLKRSQAEVVWNDAAGSSGGGDSTLWSMPAYQSSANPTLGVINPSSSATPCAAASGDCRQVPDVSADADPADRLRRLLLRQLEPSRAERRPRRRCGRAVRARQRLERVLVWPDRIREPGPIRGPAGTSAYGTMFSTTSSSATTTGWGRPPDSFPARSGYDQATGLGSPVASTLVPDLCGGPEST